MKMIRGRPFLTFVFCLVPSALILALQNPQAPPFRAGVDIFEFEVTVLDRNRRPVHGLTKDDFTVLESGKPQPIVGFSEASFPQADGPLPETNEDVAPDVTQRKYADRRLIALVMDDFGLPEGGASLRLVNDSKAIAKDVVEHLGPMDFAAVVLSRDTRYFPDFTNDRWKLGGTINEFHSISDAERGYLMLATHGHVGGLVALSDVAQYLAKLPQHRKVMVYVSIGEGIRPGSVSFDRSNDAVRVAREAGIPIYVISPAGLTMGGRNMTDVLRILADSTGGTAVVDSNDFRPAVIRVFQETQSYYLIGYQQTGPSDGKFRKIEVKVNRPGLTAYSRTGRYPPGQPDIVKAAPPPVDDAVETAVDMLTKSADKKLSAYVVHRAGGLEIAAELAPAQAAQGAWAHGVDVEARVTAGAGEVLTTVHGRIADGQASTLLRVPLPEGAPQESGRRTPIHVSVRASAGGDSLEEGADALEGGSLIEDARVSRGGASPRAPLLPVADFEFSRGERMHVELPTRAAIAERQVRLLRRTGEPLNVKLELTDRQIDGRTVLVGDWLLTFLATGDYVLEVTAKSADATARKLIAFRVR